MSALLREFAIRIEEISVGRGPRPEDTDDALCEVIADLAGIRPEPLPMVRDDYAHEAWSGHMRRALFAMWDLCDAEADDPDGAKARAIVNREVVPALMRARKALIDTREGQRFTARERALWA